MLLKLLIFTKDTRLCLDLLIGTFFDDKANISPKVESSVKIQIIGGKFT
jgi:hypothetical protein